MRYLGFLLPNLLGTVPWLYAGTVARPFSGMAALKSNALISRLCLIGDQSFGNDPRLPTLLGIPKRWFSLNEEFGRKSE